MVFFLNLGVLLTHFSMTTKICFYFFLNIDFQTSVDNIQIKKNQNDSLKTKFHPFHISSD